MRVAAGGASVGEASALAISATPDPQTADNRSALLGQEARHRKLALLPFRSRPGPADRARDARHYRRRAQVDEDVELVAQDHRVAGAQAVGLRDGDRGR